MIIAVEGIDCAGKATVCAALKEALKNDFRFIETFDFPHYQGVAGGLVGRVLRGETFVLDGKPADLEDVEWMKENWSLDKALLIQCAMLVDRCEHVDLILPFVNHDRLLILDRYYLSGLVYGQADGLDREWLVAIHRLLPRPDAFFLLDISVEESVRRRPERADYYEKNLPKLRKVREIYKSEIEKKVAPFNFSIDASRSAPQVTEEIVRIIRTVLPKSVDMREWDRAQAQLLLYREQAAAFTARLVELGDVEFVDQYLAKQDG
jgi:dTMP kinase